MAMNCSFQTNINRWMRPLIRQNLTTKCGWNTRIFIFKLISTQPSTKFIAADKGNPVIAKSLKIRKLMVDKFQHYLPQSKCHCCCLYVDFRLPGRI